MATKYNYQIIITSYGKQIQFVKSFTTASKANKHFTKMLNDNKKIIFPVRYINANKILESKYELVIIKKREKNESNITNLRNEYGDYVQNITNNKEWIVYDKSPYDFEETFWVYGFHPLNFRKDFNYIYNELVQPKASNKYDFLQFIIFKNKLILSTYNHTDLVICKNKSDCIRLYNELEKKCKNDKKVKYYLFNGDWGVTHKKRADAIDIIKKLTNWNKMKIDRSSTRP